MIADPPATDTTTSEPQAEPAGTSAAAMSRTTAGISFALAAQAVKILVQFGGMIVLTRLLRPSDYGSFSIAFSLMTFGLLFRNGFTLAAVQKDELTESQSTSLFWLNVFVGVAISGLICLSSFLMARLYRDDILMPLMVALSIAVMVPYLYNQHLAILRRRMRFGAESVIDQVAVVLATASGIAAAWCGCGIWSLAVIQIVQAGVSGLGICIASEWSPGGLPKRLDLTLLGYSKQVVISDFATYFMRNLDNQIIGLYCGMSQLGFYDRAGSITQVASMQILGPVAGVAHSTLSRLQNDIRSYRECARNVITLSAALGMFAAAFLVVDSEKLIALVLGSVWLSSAPILKVLAISAFLDAAILASYLIMLSRANMDGYLKAKVSSGLLAVVAFMCGIHWGPVGVAVGLGVSRVFTFVYALILSRHSMPGTVALIWQGLRLPALTAICAAVASCALQQMLHWSPLPALCLSMAVFATFLVGLGWATPAARNLVTSLIASRI